MTEPTGSGVQQSVARNGSTVRDWLAKIAAGLIVLFLAGAYTLVWAHDTRITVMETRDEIEFKAIKEDLGEIKADIKKLLETR